MNPTARICPACQQVLPADAPQGLCPQCLAKSALGSQVGSEETLASGSRPGGSGPATIQPEIARLFPQLEILELLGQGGMGVVYKARQPQLDRLVALKVMRADLSRDPAFAERFAREARALAKLNHPNIVAIHDSGQTGGRCWILMEFVDGLNLRQMLQTGRITPVEALGIVPKLCDALQFAHDEGVTHRDIKPENILIDRKGRVKMADFGLAKLTGGDTTDFSITATGMTMGTPKYMAPEQIENAKTVDHRADIYSLGVVFYEMLTGELPLGRFALPSQKVLIDVRLDEIVLKALEKEPSRRYQQASEVRTQVEGVTSTPVPAVKAAVQAAAADAIPVLPAHSQSSPVSPATTRFLRLMLWLVVVIGAVMFVWFEKVTLFTKPGVGESTFRIGAVQPWLVIGDRLVSYAPNFLTVSGLAGLGAMIVGMALFCFRLPKVPSFGKPAPPGACTPLEIAAAAATALAFLLGGVNALLGLAQKASPLSGVTLAALIVAAACVAALLAVQQFHPSATPARAALPELAFPALAACTGTLPWTQFINPVDGLNFWHGAGFSALNFLVALFLLVTAGASLPRMRSLIVLLTGLAGLALVLWWNAVPVMPIGSSTMTFTRKPALEGVWLAATLAVLTAIAGAVRLRAALAGSETPASTRPFAGSTGHLVLNVLLSAFTLWFVLEFGFPVAQMVTGPDIRLLELGRQWHLGTTVDSVFSKVVAFAALLAAGNFFAWRSYRRAARPDAV